MVKVEFLGPINKSDMNLDIKNLKELSLVLKKDESLFSWLEKDYELKSGDKISLLPPVCGG